MFPFNGPLVMFPSSSCTTVNTLNVAIRLSASYPTTAEGSLYAVGNGAMNSFIIRPASSYTSL